MAATTPTYCGVYVTGQPDRERRRAWPPGRVAALEPQARGLLVQTQPAHDGWGALALMDGEDAAHPLGGAGRRRAEVSPTGDRGVLVLRQLKQLQRQGFPPLGETAILHRARWMDPLDKVHNGGIVLDSLNSVTKSESSVYRIPMRFSASPAAQDCQARLNLA